MLVTKAQDVPQANGHQIDLRITNPDEPTHARITLGIAGVRPFNPNGGQVKTSAPLRDAGISTSAGGQVALSHPDPPTARQGCHGWPRCLGAVCRHLCGDHRVCPFSREPVVRSSGCFSSGSTFLCGAMRYIGTRTRSSHSRDPGHRWYPLATTSPAVSSAPTRASAGVVSVVTRCSDRA